MVCCGFSANSTVVHCTIEKRDTGYGFAEPYFIHETLRDLVMYYRETTLVEHNEILDVTLKYPVLAPAAASMHAPSTPARVVRIKLSVLFSSLWHALLYACNVCHSVSVYLCPCAQWQNG